MGKKYLQIIKLRDPYPEYLKNSYNSIIKRQMTQLIELFQRRYTNGHQVHEKLFNILSHQGNANRNHNEMPLYITRITIIKKSNVG